MQQTPFVLHDILILRSSMKRILLSLFAALSVLAPAARAEVALTPQAERAELWVQHYYQDRRPDNFLSAVLALSDDGYFERTGQPDSSIGFFAGVFAQNPAKVNFWLEHMNTLPPKHQRILAAAAWQAGFPMGAQVLDNMAFDASPKIKKEITAYMERGVKPISQVAVNSESSMYLRWGAFMADGDERHVLAVLAALGSGEPNLTASACYVLAENAAKHARVMQICQAQLDKQPAAVREELRAALNSPAVRSNGS